MIQMCCFFFVFSALNTGQSKFSAQTAAWCCYSNMNWQQGIENTLSPLLANPLWLLFLYVSYWFLTLLITNAFRVLWWCMAFHLQQQLWLRLFLIVVSFNPQDAPQHVSGVSSHFFFLTPIIATATSFIVRHDRPTVVPASLTVCSVTGKVKYHVSHGGGSTILYILILAFTRWH